MDKLINEFSIGLFFWQTVLFLALLFLLRKYAWKPILNALNDREEGIKNALDSAEKARQEMENLNADNERILKEARTERETMLKEAREMKAKMISDAKEEAQTQGIAGQPIWVRRPAAAHFLYGFHRGGNPAGTRPHEGQAFHPDLLF